MGYVSLISEHENRIWRKKGTAVVKTTEVYVELPDQRIVYKFEHFKQGKFTHFSLQKVCVGLPSDKDYYREGKRTEMSKKDFYNILKPLLANKESMLLDTRNRSHRTSTWFTKGIKQ